jgi:hypothetical protein
MPFNEYVAHLGDEAGAQQRFQQGGRPYLAHRQQRPTWLSWQGTPTSALWEGKGGSTNYRVLSCCLPIRVEPLDTQSHNSGGLGALPAEHERPSPVSEDLG